MLSSRSTSDQLSEPKRRTDTSLSLPPSSMRSSKSVYSQVIDTLTEMVKRPKHIQQDANSEVAHKKRTNEAFLKRLKTFSVSNWMGKPLCLSPPLLSQYGWQCIGADTIKCCSCSSVIYVQLPMPCAGNYREQCYKTRQKILDSHMKICSWPSYPCSDSLVAPFLNGVQDPLKIIEEFIERRRNLLQLGSKLPRLEKKLLMELNLKQNDLTALALLQPIGESMTSAKDELTRLDICSILAMCGWDSRDNETTKTPSIFCEVSDRSIKLHNVFTVDENIDDNSESPKSPKDTPQMPSEEAAYESSPKRSKSDIAPPPRLHSPLKIIKKYFHPIQQHCSWSYWVTVLKPITREEFDKLEEDASRYLYVVNPSVENGEPGWKVLMQTLLGSNCVLKSLGGCESVENSTEVPFNAKDTLPENLDTKSKVKLSPEKAVADFHQLMADITSRK